MSLTDGRGQCPERFSCAVITVVHVTGATRCIIDDAHIARIAELILAIQIQARLVNTTQRQAVQRRTAGIDPAPQRIDKRKLIRYTAKQVFVQLIIRAHPLLAKVEGQTHHHVILSLCMYDGRFFTQELVQHLFKIGKHHAQEAVRLFTGNAVRIVIGIAARAVTNGPLAVVPYGVLQEALMILDKLNAFLTGLQLRQLRLRFCRVGRVGRVGRLIVIRVAGHRIPRPAGINGQILRYGQLIDNLRAVLLRGKPAGKVVAAARCQRKLGIGLAGGVAKHGIVLGLAAVAVKDKITEAGSCRSLIVFVKEKLKLADTAIKELLREIRTDLHPCTHGIGQLDLAEFSGGKHTLHAVIAAEDIRPVIERKVDQRIGLRLRKRKRIACGKRRDSLLGLRKSRGAGNILVAHFLHERKTVRTEPIVLLRIGLLLGRKRRDQHGRKEAGHKEYDKGSSHGFTSGSEFAENLHGFIVTDFFRLVKRRSHRYGAF